MKRDEENIKTKNLMTYKISHYYCVNYIAFILLRTEFNSETDEFNLFFSFILQFVPYIAPTLLSSSSTKEAGVCVIRPEVPEFLIQQLRNYIRMLFLTITHRWEPRELAEAPCSRMLGRS